MLPYNNEEMKLFPLQMAFMMAISVSLWTTSVDAGRSSVQRNRNHRKMRSNITVALILPKIHFGKRNYQKAVNDALFALQKSKNTKFKFLHTHGQVQVHSEMLSLTPSPTGNGYTV
jgi:predicted RNA-binding protein with EMAP domain